MKPTRKFIGWNATDESDDWLILNCNEQYDMEYKISLSFPRRYGGKAFPGWRAFIDQLMKQESDNKS